MSAKKRAARRSRKADPYADVRGFVPDEVIAQFEASLDAYINDWSVSVERIIVKRQASATA
jgi:hypothetical protein